MMNPQWSRFLGQVVNSDWFLALPDEKRSEFRDAAIRTETRSDLPAWAIELLEQHEGET